ncbi:MAG: hypothetical protein J1F35_00515 [Erysipelotrichales bacterium]|nr:hypothetical protein [Erysipelotrichales bacterium]
MKKVLLMIAVITFLTACKAANGNSVSKLETTIYKTNNHEEILIQDGFDYIKDIFTDKDTFYHASLLTMEYGNNDTLEKEEIVKNSTKSYDVLYITFSFETGDVLYETMQSNHVYKYETYLVKSYEHDSWHIYKMEAIN